MAAEASAAALWRAIESLNAGEVEKAREELHALMLASPARLRPFYQGMVTLALGLNHLRRGEQPGLLRMLRQAGERLAPLRPDFLGVDIDRLLDSIEAARDEALRLGVRRFDAFPAELRPRIALLPRGSVEAVEIDGARLSLRRWGGSGQTIVLIPPPGHAATVWTPVAARLAPRFQVLAPDLPGHADSTWPGSAEEAIAALRRWARLLSPPPALFAGLGFTANLAGLAAEANGAAHAAFAPDALTGPADAGSASRRRAIWGTRFEMFEAYAAREPFASWRPDLLWLYIEDGTVVLEDGRVGLRCPPAIEAAYLELAAAASSTAPVTIAESPLVRPDAAAAALSAAFAAD